MSKHAETIFAAVESGGATSALISSWRRSVRFHGLHPDMQAAPEHDSAALRDGLERDAQMVALCLPYLDELYGALDETEAVVGVTDSTGLMLAQRTGRKHDIWRRDASKVVGTRYAERDVGTSPIGTVLVEERPLVVGHGTWFLHKYSSLVGMGAPIFGPDGQLAGVFCCSLAPQSGLPQRSREKLIFMALSNFARRIGIELFASTFPKSRLVQVSPDGALPCALIAVAPDDGVLGATRTARRMLGLSDARLSAPLNVRDLFGAPTLDDLAAAEAKLIAQTMARHATNRSAVAKALGISRSTLYRKLRGLRWDTPRAAPTVGRD